jgi:UMF1 family MFS transporter
MSLSSRSNHHHDSNEHQIFASAPMDAAVRYVPRWMRFENAPIEANGLAVDIYARATILMSSMFLGPALLELANDAAQLACLESGSEESCGDDAKIYGFRPSSLLSNIAILSGVACSVALPFIGALVDHTPYRRQVGAYSALALVVVKASEVMVGEHTWLLVAMLQVFSAIFFSFHNTSTYAYTSDLAPDAGTQSYYNSHLYVIMFVSTLVFLVLVLGFSAFLQVSDVGTARISQTITSTISAALFYFCWSHLFRDKPPLSCVPPGMSLWSCGFLKVFRSVRRIVALFPALMWLMAAIAFESAAASALISIATTYFKETLKMDATEIGLVFFITLCCGIPGSKIAAFLAERVNPIHNLILCNSVFGISCCAAALMLTTPEQKNLVFFFGAVWGIGLGWQGPIEISAFISLVEKGQEAEMMGIYLLVTNILSWLPPLVFTAINEGGLPMMFGLGSLGLFFGLAIISLICMGGYEDALQTLELVQHTGSDHGHENYPIEIEVSQFRPISGKEDGLPASIGVIS